MRFYFSILLILFLNPLNSQIHKDILFSVDKNWKGRYDSLKADVVLPFDNNEHPLIVVLHGGALLNGNKSDYHEYCVLFAKQGFVAVAINYRLGYYQSPKHSNTDKLDSSYYLAEYRAQQDLYAAIDFFYVNADQFRIDKEKIVVAGFSSGGDVCLLSAFASREDWNRSEPWIESRLGKIDPFNSKEKIKVVGSLWGAITDTFFISKVEAQKIPLILFHGTDDPAVPYERTPENYGTSFFGAYTLAQRYKDFSACYELNSVVHGGHMDGFSKKEITGKIADFTKKVFSGHCVARENFTEIPLKEEKGSNFILIAFCVLMVLLIFFFRRKRA